MPWSVSRTPLAHDEEFCCNGCCDAVAHAHTVAVEIAAETGAPVVVYLFKDGRLYAAISSYLGRRVAQIYL